MEIHKQGCPMFATNWAASIPRYCNCNEDKPMPSGHSKAPESNYFETNKESALKFEAPTDESWKSEITSLVGEASMCWNPTPTGVFDSEEAITIAFKICKMVEELLQKEREKAHKDGYLEASHDLQGERAMGKSEAFSLVRKMVHEATDLRDPKTQIYKIINAHDFLTKLSALEGK